MARILVVDDDPWIQRTASSVLGQRGHQVSLAGDAEGAAAIASKIRPDLIFACLSLPSVAGWAWWERLRTQADFADIPIVFLLSSAERDPAIPGETPSDGRLRKPFRVEELERMAIRALTGHELDSPAGQPRQTPPPRRARVLDPTKPSAGFRPLSALRGELDKIGLSSVLTILEMERQSGIVLVEQAEGAARLYLRKGRIIRADGDNPPLTGSAAVYEVLTWSSGSFDFLCGDVGGVDEIQTSTTFLLMEGARRVDEAKEQRRLDALETKP